VQFRIGVLSSQFSDNVDSGIEIHNEVAKTLQKKFDELECHLGPSSPVIKCLSQCDNTCAALESKLGTIKPTLNALETSAKALTVTENALVQDLASFGKKLADAQLSTSNPSLEADLASKFAENTLLQAQLHDVGSKIDILQQTVHEKEILIIDTQEALVEITSKQQKAECENKQLETEKAALQLQLEDTEQRIRHELGKQNTDLMDQMRADHQAEIDGFQKGKDEVEEVSGKLMIQLGGIQNSLVSIGCT
jgi:chromosome segregation ATPase